MENHAHLSIGCVEAFGTLQIGVSDALNPVKDNRLQSSDSLIGSVSLLVSSETAPIDLEWLDELTPMPVSAQVEEPCPSSLPRRRVHPHPILTCGKLLSLINRLWITVTL